MQALEHLNRGCLAGAIGAEQAKTRACANLEINARNRAFVAVCLHQVGARNCQFSQYARTVARH
jgi:hypothetical protein